MKMRIQNIGTISTKSWLGGISAQKMLTEGFVSEKLLQKALESMDSYYVAVDPRAETRCIDGRCAYSQNAAHLGAQLPGGTPGGALAYRLGVIREHRELGTFCDDADIMLAAFVENGMVPGDHRDTHDSGVGCGAIDKMPQALEAMLSPVLIAEHERLTHLLLGESFDEDTYLSLMGSAVILEGRAAEYFTGREHSVDTLEEHLMHKVSVLEGDHHECIVCINLVPETTFDNKRFSDDYGGMQAFNYDFWQTLAGAQRIFGSDATSSERFIMARVMTAVATLMVLTDGTQELLIRAPA